MANCVKKGQKEEQIASQKEIELRKKKANCVPTERTTWRKAVIKAVGKYTV